MNLKRLLSKVLAILFAFPGLLVSGLLIFIKPYPVFGAGSKQK